MNLNNLARKITLLEGKKKSISIAQVKEVMKLTLKELSHLDDEELDNTLSRYY